MPYCGIASGVLSIFMVRAERRCVDLVGSGSPVKGATLVRFNRDVANGPVFVVDDVPSGVVVVESAWALDAPRVATLKLTTVTSPITRRIKATYMVRVAQSRHEQTR
jgi:hypothetical protein